LCSFKLVKTESGERRKLPKVIIPELLPNKTGAPGFSGKMIEDLMRLLIPIHKKSGNLIKGSVKQVKQWSIFVSNPNWFKCLKELSPKFSLQNHTTVLKTIA
jgi:hypothetical protein